LYSLLLAHKVGECIIRGGGDNVLLLNYFGEELLMIVFSMWWRSVPVWHRLVHSVIMGLWQWQWLRRLLRWTKLQWVH